MRLFRYLSLALFAIYLAIFPGSAVVVALDRVPAWGDWMGGAMLLLQGGAVLLWLIGFYGRRGALAAAAVFMLAWAVEHLGVASGFPFGRYTYTDMLQPQLFGVVPLAIGCAWIMVSIGAWQMATADYRRLATGGRGDSSTVGGRWSAIVAATLVLLLDLQIETVATRINRYWVWIDGGPYYGVPTANFVAWWLVGLVMALVVSRILTADDGRRAIDVRRSGTTLVLRSTLYALRFIPAYFYLLSTVMFTVVNLARGYTIAGLVGVAVLLGVAIAILEPLSRPRGVARPLQGTQTE